MIISRKKRRVARILKKTRDVNTWSYQRGYAQGHADGSATVAKCRGFLHMPSSAPHAELCRDCARLVPFSETADWELD